MRSTRDELIAVKEAHDALETRHRQKRRRFRRHNENPDNGSEDEGTNTIPQSAFARAGKKFVLTIMPWLPPATWASSDLDVTSAEQSLSDDDKAFRAAYHCVEKKYRDFLRQGAYQTKVCSDLSANQ